MTSPDESTPEKLRAARHVIEAPEVLAAADAWEADLRDYEILKGHHDLHHKDDEGFRARIEALENVVAAKQNIIKSIQATVNDHLEAEAALRSEEETHG